MPLALQTKLDEGGSSGRLPMNTPDFNLRKEGLRIVGQEPAYRMVGDWPNIR